MANQIRIESKYPARYAEQSVSQIYRQINENRLSLAVGFRGVGKSSIANFLAYNTKHSRYYRPKRKLVIAKFSFTSSLDKDPRGFLYNLIKAIERGFDAWDQTSPLDLYVGETYTKRDMLQILRRLLLRMHRQQMKLVIVVDPVERIREYDEHLKIFEFLRHLFDHYREALALVFFSGVPNIVKAINSDNFGDLSASLNSAVIWIQPTSIENYQYYLYHDYPWWRKLAIFRPHRRVEEYVHKISGGIVALMNHFRGMSEVNNQVMQDSLNRNEVLTTCRRILDSFTDQQQLFLYYVANNINKQAQITRADINILISSGILVYSDKTSSYHLRSQLLAEYLRL